MSACGAGDGAQRGVTREQLGKRAGHVQVGLWRCYRIEGVPGDFFRRCRGDVSNRDFRCKNRSTCSGAMVRLISWEQSGSAVGTDAMDSQGEGGRNKERRGRQIVGERVTRR